MVAVERTNQGTAYGNCRLPVWSLAKLRPGFRPFTRRRLDQFCSTRWRVS